MVKIKMITFAVVLLFAINTFGQLAMQLASNQKNYMIYEPVYLCLRIKNDSGRPLVFGQTKALQTEVFFELQDSNYRPLKNIPAKAVPLNKGKVINPGEISDIIFKFNEIHDITKAGIYRVHAYIKHPQLKEQFKSNDLRFDVSNGSEVWSQEIGLPENYFKNAQDKVSMDNSRIFRIKTLIDGTNKYFYCVLEDSKKIYQMLRLSQVYGIDLPRTEVDMLGALHVLVPYGSKLYKYYQIDIDGQFASKVQYLKSGKTSPVLIRTSTGKVNVVGGEKAVANVDYLVETPIFKIQ